MDKESVDQEMVAEGLHWVTNTGNCCGATFLPSSAKDLESCLSAKDHQYISDLRKHGGRVKVNFAFRKDGIFDPFLLAIYADFSSLGYSRPWIQCLKQLLFK